MGRRQRLQRRRVVGVDPKSNGVAASGRPRRGSPVAGQMQARLETRQLPSPEGEAALEVGRGQGFTLPKREVSVLERH